MLFRSRGSRPSVERYGARDARTSGVDGTVWVVVVAGCSGEGEGAARWKVRERNVIILVS